LKGVNARKILGVIVILVVFLSFTPFLTPKVAASFPSANIMPLGDSITVGLPGLDGYRESLYQDLNDFGFAVDFVGSQSAGTGDFDKDNEGHSGFTADQISANIDTWLTSNPAEVILLHIGTNDVEEGQTATAIVESVQGILNEIDDWAVSNATSITVVLAKIILRSDNSIWNQTTMDYNDQLVSMASTRSNVVIVDMEHALSYPTDLSADGIHPNELGYEKMADIWYDALTDVLGYSLTLNYVGNGEVTADPAHSFYPYSAVVNLAALPDDGWVFSGWSGDLGGSINPQSIVMNTNRTVTVTFTRIQYSMTISTNFGTTIPNFGNYSYYAGAEVNITACSPSAVAGERYIWQGWTGVGSGSYTGMDQQATVVMNGPIIQTASWLHEYNLTVTSAHGTIEGEGWYAEGSSAYATVYPASVTSGGNTYIFSYWSDDASGSSLTSNAITMNGSKTATAVWVQQSSPTPSPAPTPKATPKPTNTPNPTASPTPSIGPTITPSPSPTVEPSNTPTASDSNGPNIYLIIGIIGLSIACASIGFFVYRGTKK
jgi:lysophospholipase L1-like esterase